MSRFRKVAFAADDEWITEPAAPPVGDDPASIHAAMRDIVRDRSTRRRAADDDSNRWIGTAWDAYRRVPEIKAAVNYKANATSRCRLFVAEVPRDGSEPVPLKDTPANRPITSVLDAIAGGFEGQPEYLRQLSRHRSVAGASVTVVVHLDENERREHGEDSPWLWRVLSSKHLESKGNIKVELPTANGVIVRTLMRRVDHASGSWSIQTPPGVRILRDQVLDPDDPNRRLDSPVKTLLETAETLTAIADSIHAAAVSRARRDGIIALDPSVTVPNVDEEKREALEREYGDLALHVYTEKMSADMRNLRSAESTVPFWLRVARDPDDERALSDLFHHIRLESSFDEHARELFELFAKRVGVGMDTPVEVVSGFGDTNHWNALMIGQDGARMHVAPDMAAFCGMFTRFARQRWAEERVSVRPGRHMIWYDASSLTQDPDRLGSLLEVERVRPGTITAAEIRQAAGLSVDVDPQPVVEAPRRNGSASSRRRVPAIASTGAAQNIGVPAFPERP